MQLVPQHSGEVTKENFVPHFKHTYRAVLAIWAWLEQEKKAAIADERELTIPPDVQKKLGEALTAMEIAQPIVEALV